MAKIKTGPLVAEASGSVGGTVFSRNRYGQYTRQRRVPVNPNTAAQGAIRNAFTYITQYWRDTLTQAQRDGWERYAQATPISDVFGDSQILAGNVMFCRFNVHWYRTKSAVVAAAPPSPGEAPSALMTVAGDTTLGVVISAFTPGVTAPDQVSVSLAASAASQARNFYRGPYQFNIMEADADLPHTIVAAGSCAIGQRWFLKSRVFLADGRVGPENQTQVDILT